MRRVAALMILLSCLAGTGCGVPIESQPRPADNIRTPDQQPIASAPSPGAAVQTLYLVEDGKLVAVQRQLAAEPTLPAILQALLAGPTPGERKLGIISALLGASPILDAQVRDGTAYLELAADLEGTGRTDDVLGFAQLVCTLTTRRDITKVVFTRDGVRIRVPRADLSLTDQPLSATDYVALLTQ